MRKVSLSISLGILFTLALIHSPLIGSSASAKVASLVGSQGRSSIYGMIYGDAGRPVSDVYVELLDDFNATIRQQRTDSSGRFQFSMAWLNGRYIIKIRPGNTGYLNILSKSLSPQFLRLARARARDQGGSDNQHLDIVLKLDERGMYGPFYAARESVFAQEIPPVAKRNYEEGIAFI